MVASPNPQPRPIPLALIADADADSRELFGAILADTAHEIIYASDGAEALALAIARRPQLVVAETSLPRVDGLALCRCLRQEHSTAQAWILVITADARAEMIVKARAAGANTVLSKPVAPDLLLSSLTEFAARCQVEAQIPSRGRKRELARAVLHCPKCAGELRHEQTFTGGIRSAPESWEYYRCLSGCGTYRYRPRTRQLHRIQ